MVETGASQFQFVTFKIGDESFGIEVTRAREILNLTHMTQVPQTPEYMLGVINLRGQVVPVVDMRLRLGITANDFTQDTCVIVVEIQSAEDTVVIGLLVDSVCEVLDILDSQIGPPPQLGTKIDIAFILGMGNLDGDFILLLDIDRFFNADQAKLISSLSQTSEEADDEYMPEEV